MTTPLIDPRPRGAVVAELYDRHAAGLFAYCHDQLGDTASAANALVAVLTRVPAVEPPRAALYALARREIYRRDVAYAFPFVDPVADPPTATIERVLREVRPHQREVLLLSAVCGLDTAELSWVLDVAADTAEDLVLSARHRFAQSLAHSVNSALAAGGLPPAVAEVYEALTVARPEDALARLPWHPPPAALRLRVLSGLPDEPVQPAAGRHRWPTTPRWPLPLAEPDPRTAAAVFPPKKLPPVTPPAQPEPAVAEQAAELAPPVPGRRSRHEATTEPLPKVRDTLPAAPARQRRRLHALGKPLPRPIGAPRDPETATEAGAPPLAAPVLDVTTAPDTAPSDPSSPVTDTPRRRKTPPPDRKVAPFPSPARPEPTRDDAAVTDPATKPERVTEPATDRVTEPVSDGVADPVTGRVAEPVAARAAEPVTAPPADLLSDPEPPVADPQPPVADAGAPPVTGQPTGTAVPDTAPEGSETVPEADSGAVLAALTRTAEPRAAKSSRGTMGPRPRQPRQHKRPKPIKVGEHHYDWLWELVGFILCVAIALGVFFAVPTIVTP
ncbi:RNA polymerase sigma factor [Sphaerisporangium aureirubrum]|uniref:RNA polymerase sigma factor 70 region 4 type 2 domain-containing protein n=1 Tax=Sphaerisporangium aureirubrum TaxID=1544736 RepID=A0ABW1NES5_9ACTN